MPKRKGNGEGMTRKRADGRWEARFSYIDDFGKINSKSFYGKTKAEAFEKMQNAKIALKYNCLENELDKTTTLSEWIEFYFSTFKLNKIEFNTLNSYTSTYLNHIKESLGNKLLNKITTLDIQKIINGVDISESTRTAENILVVFKDAFKYAKIHNYIKNDPTEGVILPLHKQKNSRALTKSERNSFKENLNKLSLRDQCLLLFYFTTGARKSEILALRWDDILFDLNRIDINSSYKRSQYGYEIGNTKTKNETLVPLDVSLKEKLLILKQQSQSKYIFNSVNDVNKPLDIYKPNKIICEYRYICGIDDLTIINLRHTFVTICAECGIKKSVVKYWLKHKGDSKMIDKVYEHILDDFSEQQATLLKNAF